jgi:hypothetical protein
MIWAAPTDAAFRHDRLMIVLRPCAVCHKFQLCTGFTRPFWSVRCRPAEGAGRLPKRTAEAGRLLGVPYDIAVRRWERTRSQIVKNTRLWPRPLTSQTAFGGQLPYKGSLVRPAVRFDHSLFKYNGRLLRATCRVSGCTQDSRGLFGLSGADQRKAQDGCQNGQQRLDALFRTSPTKAPLGAFFLRAEVHSRKCRHSEFVAAKRHFESEAACELRGR